MWLVLVGSGVEEFDGVDLVGGVELEVWRFFCLRMRMLYGSECRLMLVCWLNFI